MLRSPLSSPLSRPLQSPLAARRGGVPDPAPPVNVSLPSIMGTPAVGSEVTANQGGWSGYPSISYAYQWRRDGVNISGATAQTYTIQAADYEADLDVVVSATNTEGGPVAATSPAVTVIGVAPVNTVAPAVSGSSGLGDVLTTTNGTWTGYPASFSYAYQWRRNGSNIGGATASSYTIVAGDSAASITCLVTATNAQGSTAQASNGITVQTFSAPVISGVPTISGTAEVGETLTATAASVTGNPTPSRTWQWLRDGSNISGATSSTYTLVSADGGTDVSVRQTETNALGADDAVSAVVEIPGASSLTAQVQALFSKYSAEGGMWDYTNSDRLRQNDNGTTAVSNGNTVGWVEDLSGLGKHRTNSNASRRPVWSSSGHVVFDGVDDELNVTAVFSANRPGLFVGGCVRNVGGTALRVEWAQGTSEHFIGAQIASLRRMQIASRSGGAGTITTASTAIDSIPEAGFFAYHGSNNRGDGQAISTVVGVGSGTVATGVTSVTSGNMNGELTASRANFECRRQIMMSVYPDETDRTLIGQWLLEGL